MVGRRLTWLFLLGAAACAPPAEVPAADSTARTHQIQNEGLAGATPSVAVNGNRVLLTWSQTAADGRSTILAAVSADGGRTLGPAVQVNDDAASPRPSGEQSPRAAWLGDDIAVVWPGRRGEASEILYALSTDGGQTFSSSQPIHASGLSGLRGWADVTADANGNLHVTWLDGRNATTAAAGEHAHGAAPASGGAPRQDLYHAVRHPDGRVEETQVATDVCFCCKTSVVAVAGRAEVAWRHIFPGSIRDIGYAIIGDGVAATGRVSEDDWELNACPDDGPSVVVTGSRRHVVWPTLVSAAPVAKGVFYAASEDGRTFSARERLDSGVSTQVSHPRIAVDTAGGLTAVWDERRDGALVVVMRSRPANSAVWGAERVLDDVNAAFYPAVAFVPDAMLLAWTSVTEPETSVRLRRVPLSQTELAQRE